MTAAFAQVFRSAFGLATPLAPLAADLREAPRAPDFLSELRRELEAHGAVNHLFLNRLATSPFSREDYRVVAENHYSMVRVFTHYLERLLIRAPDGGSKLWLAKVLVDEYGEGSHGEDHPTLYRDFLSATGSRALDGGEEALRVPAPALEFIQEHLRIVADEPFLVGLGAVGPGHEWSIPKMFAAIIPGLRRAGFDPHEMRYFTLHVEQDVDHGSWLEEALRKLGDGDDARAQIRRGAMLSLAARGRFWDGVQRAVVRWRQPRAARPDGPIQRTLGHELMLTIWDGLPAARRLEEGIELLREKSRPTLGALLRRISR